MLDERPTSESAGSDLDPEIQDPVGYRYRLNKFTLYFDDREVETNFSRSSLKKSLPIIRLSLALAALLYGAFGFLDYVLLGPDAVPIWIIRYCGVCPALLIVMALTYHPRFYYFSQPALIVSTMSAGLGVVAMTVLTEPPTNYYYYAGLIMVVIFASTLIRLRHQYSAAAALAMVVIYEIATLTLNPVPDTVLISNNFFLIMALSIGVFANYALELYYRKEYISTQLLFREKARTDVLLRKTQIANEAKSNFLAIVSHELRTPLNAIIGFSELMKTQVFGSLGSEKYEDYVNDIHASGQHLLEIINDILDLSKAEAGKLKLVESEVQLSELMDESAKIFREPALAAGLQFSSDMDQDLHLRVDQRLIRQVMVNLLSNAVKFTEQGGSIEVSTERHRGAGFSMVVSDTGIGIKKEDQEKVLQPFVQVENALCRSHEGTGLGLPLVQKIVNLHGGKLTINSQLGVGTRVRVTLPEDRVLGPAEAPDVAVAKSA